MGRGRERFVDVGARSTPGRTGLFRLRVDMPRAGMRGGAAMVMNVLVNKKTLSDCREMSRYRPVKKDVVQGFRVWSDDPS